MSTVTVPCDCEHEEHEVEVSAELGGYGIRARIGLYAPSIGDKLPCGRELTERDLTKIVERLEEWGTDEGD